MAGERLSLLSVVLRRSWGGTGGDQRSFIFQAVLTPSPLHIGVLVVVASGSIALVCLSLAVISIRPFLPSVFFSQLVSITLSCFPPLLICRSVWQTVAVSPSALFTQSAYGSPQSSVTPATARGACKGVWLIDHVGITH